MVFSKYNICVILDETVIVYNTNSGIILEIDHVLFDKLHNSNYISPTFIPLNYFEFLCENKIIADDDIELKSIISRKLSRGMDYQNLYFLITPTLKCNLKCSYCFQSSYGKNSMDLSVAENLVKFIIHKTSTLNPNHIHFEWSGGEPLLSIDIIEYILSDLRRKTTKKFTNKIITNGTLLSFNILKRLSDLNFSSIQITIDGIEELHNQRRSVDYYDSYSSIISNIDYLLKNYPLIHLSIRVNIDRLNRDEFPKLILLFDKLYRGCNYSIAPAFVENFSSAVLYSNILNHNERSRFYLEIIKNSNMAIINSLFETPQLFCMKYNNHTFGIGPNGEVVNCEMDVGKSNLTPMSNIEKLNNHANRDQFELHEKCYSCNLLPLCNGGCSRKCVSNTTINERCHIIKGNESEYVYMYYLNNNE